MDDKARSAELHSAVSQNCILRGVSQSEHAGTCRRPADWKSAIQQIENLRYGSPVDLSSVPRSDQYVRVIFTGWRAHSDRKLRPDSPALGFEEREHAADVEHHGRACDLGSPFSGRQNCRRARRWHRHAMATRLRGANGHVGRGRKASTGAMDATSPRLQKSLEEQRAARARDPGVIRQWLMFAPIPAPRRRSIAFLPLSFHGSPDLVQHQDKAFEHGAT